MPAPTDPMTKVKVAADSTVVAAQSVTTAGFWTHTAIDSVSSVFGRLSTAITQSPPATFAGRLRRAYLDFMLKNAPETPAETRAFNHLHAIMLMDLKKIREVEAMMANAAKALDPSSESTNRRHLVEDLSAQFERANAHYNPSTKSS